MLILQNLSYTHPDKELLFDNINLIINEHDKVALIGDNGAGKSTLLKIIAGWLEPSAGILDVDVKPYYVPQVFGQYNHLTIAQALNVEDKLKALKDILAGNVTEQNMILLDDDWTVEERCHEALQYWQLDQLDITQPVSTLSGGQKTKVFLAGILLHQPEFILLDEPSNHLDVTSRELLYSFIENTKSTLIVVSHDRKLLNILTAVYELDKRGITMYSGNYDFYAEQKAIENNALYEDVKSKEKALRKAKEKERETIERQQRLDARGRKKQERAGLPTIMMNTFKNNAEKSTAKLKDVHAEKTGMLAKELNDLRKTLPGADTMRFDFDDSTLHKGKILFRASNINFSYADVFLWKENIDIQITSNERIAIKGLNGSGKTTLIKIILGQLQQTTGSVYRAINSSVYIDQDYSLIKDEFSVYEQAQQFNTTALQEHEIKNRLNRFLFTKEFWDKPCNALSGGEKMRLMICCLNISSQAPDIIVLDEPTNNLDIQNIEILTAAIYDYKGTVLVVSHDAIFLEQINITRTIELVNA